MKTMENDKKIKSYIKVAKIIRAYLDLETYYSIMHLENEARELEDAILFRKRGRRDKITVSYV